MQVIHTRYEYVKFSKEAKINIEEIADYLMIHSYFSNIACESILVIIKNNFVNYGSISMSKIIAYYGVLFLRKNSLNSYDAISSINKLIFDALNYRFSMDLDGPHQYAISSISNYCNASPCMVKLIVKCVKNVEIVPLLYDKAYQQHDFKKDLSHDELCSIYLYVKTTKTSRINILFNSLKDITEFIDSKNGITQQNYKDICKSYWVYILFSGLSEII